VEIKKVRYIPTFDCFLFIYFFFLRRGPTSAPRTFSFLTHFSSFEHMQYPTSGDDSEGFSDSEREGKPFSTTFRQPPGPKLRIGSPRNRYFTSAARVCGDWEELVAPAGVFGGFWEIPCPVRLFLRCLSDSCGVDLPFDVDGATFLSLADAVHCTRNLDFRTSDSSVLRWKTGLERAHRVHLDCLAAVLDRVAERTFCQIGPVVMAFLLGNSFRTKLRTWALASCQHQQPRCSSD